MKKSLLSVFLLFSAFAINAVTIGMQPSDLGYSTAVSAAITRSYDGTGKVKRLNFGDNISQSFAYNVNGWLTSSTATAWMSGQVYPSDASAYPAPAGISLPGTTTIEECIHYADEVSGASPRYDGKISARSCGSLLTAYGYDSHGRLASSQTHTVSSSPLVEAPDYSTAYTYDRNANITSLTRQGIIDRSALLRNEYGLHSSYTMTYVHNQLTGMTIEREGEDYEGRTGAGASGSFNNFFYDANGNLGRDLSRGIVSTNYNWQNLPTNIYFLNGHRQTITYDGFGQKRRVSYSQTSDPILGSMMGVPEDSAYTLQGRRDYIGPHVFVGDSLEYSAFPGGYFTPEGVFYYITDWQGNNIAVFSDKGELVQQTTYYPYGEPTIEPQGQRYLFGGKEREHAGGRNSYDYGPRSLGPSGNWDSADRKSESYYPISPFSYCGGDPINYIDPTGMKPTPYEACMMAAAAYKDMDETYNSCVTSLEDRKWQVVDKIIIIDKSLSSHPLEFIPSDDSMIFMKKNNDGTKEYAYAFAGSNEASDWVENGLQLVGLAQTYNDAIESSKDLKGLLKDSQLTLIGHSYGGGKAAAASMATGCEAITFNTAAVTPLTKWVNNLSDESHITNYRIVPSGTSKIGLGGCFINNVQDNLKFSAPGTTIPIENKSNNPFSAHRIGTCLKYFQK